MDLQTLKASVWHAYIGRGAFIISQNGSEGHLKFLFFRTSQEMSGGFDYGGF